MLLHILDLRNKYFQWYIVYVEYQLPRLFTSTCYLQGEKLASTTQGEKEDLDQAVEAAKEAFKDWSKLTPHRRARHIYSIARHVQKHMRLVAVLESLDNGKSIRETRDADTQIVARHLYHHAGWAELMETEMKGVVQISFSSLNNLLWMYYFNCSFYM